MDICALPQPPATPLTARVPAGRVRIRGWGEGLLAAEQELAQIKGDTPPLLVAALRERELTFRNSKAFHEAYFANLGWRRIQRK